MRSTVGMILASTLVASLIASTSAAFAQSKAAFHHKDLARVTLDKHIRPGYQQLAQSGSSLTKAVGNYCSKPGASNYNTVNTAFDGFVTAWGRIEHITFGPISTDNRIERILFFPDRRGLAARQVETALRTRDVSVTEVDSLSRKSVGLQGLGAFELVMLGKADRSEPAESREHRCRFAHAIAGNLTAISQAVSNEWLRDDGFAKQWLEPGTANPTFLKDTETTFILAKALTRGIEQVRDDRIVAPLGFGPQRRKMPAPLQFSGRTMRLVQANIDGLHHLWTAGGMQAAIIREHQPRAADSVPDFAKQVASELQTASKLAGGLLTQRKPFDDPKAKRDLISMGFPLKNARYLATQLLSEEAGVTLGFNASDGD